MQIKGKFKLGMISVELVLGILAATVVLFVVFGSFSENVCNLAENSNINRITSQNTAKVSYADYGRSYANSTIYVK